MDLMGIGEFAQLSWLSPRALRLYDELGLLPPARVDPDSGYRWYAAGHLDRARLVATLRQLDIPPEWCWPVPDEQAAEIAARFPDLTLRTEPAHQEAFIHLGPG
jgi:protein phosphatase